MGPAQVNMPNPAQNRYRQSQSPASPGAPPEMGPDGIMARNPYQSNNPALGTMQSQEPPRMANGGVLNPPSQLGPPPNPNVTQPPPSPLTQGDPSVTPIPQQPAANRITPQSPALSPRMPAPTYPFSR